MYKKYQNIRNKCNMTIDELMKDRQRQIHQNDLQQKRAQIGGSPQMIVQPFNQDGSKYMTHKPTGRYGHNMFT